MYKLQYVITHYYLQKYQRKCIALFFQIHRDTILVSLDIRKMSLDRARLCTKVPVPSTVAMQLLSLLRLRVTPWAQLGFWVRGI